MSDLQPSYSVQVLSPEESVAVLRHLGRPVPAHHKKIVLAAGLEISGKFNFTARNVKSGKVEWEHEQENLLTDSGRRYFSWGGTGFGAQYVGFCPSKETPSPYRYSLPTDTTQYFDSQSSNYGGTVTPSVNTLTFTKQFGVVTWGAPPSNRTLGTIFLSRIGSSSNPIGPVGVHAFAVLSPSRVQTTTQTLEVIYKISMTPIY